MQKKECTQINGCCKNEKNVNLKVEKKKTIKELIIEYIEAEMDLNNFAIVSTHHLEELAMKLKTFNTYHLGSSFLRTWRRMREHKQYPKEWRLIAIKDSMEGTHKIMKGEKNAE